jgi:2'-5' RNA ligase
VVDVAGILVRDARGQILVLQRPDGSWDVPKGLVKSTESPIQTARRETREETGLRPKLSGETASVTYRGDQIWIFDGVATGRVRLSDEHIGYDWVSADKAVSILFPPLRKVVSKLREGNMNEERELNPDGTTSCGVFLPIPFDMGKDFPDKWHEDDSVPHLTILYAGDLTPAEFKKLVKVVRVACTHIRPFEADLRYFREFQNAKGQRIPHMRPSYKVSMRLASIHGILRRAAEAEGLKIAHTYGERGNDGLPYEIRYTAHATLAYLDPESTGPYYGPRPTGSWWVNELEVWGHEQVRVPLGRNRYNQPTGLRKDPVAIHYPMAVPDVAKEDVNLSRTPLLIEGEINELRDSCLNCIRKHLGQAAALMDETKQGYPAHRWLAIGHLGEAASEALKKFPKLADEIREHRIKYISNPDYAVPVVELIEKASKLVSEAANEDHKDQITGGIADKSMPSDFDPKELAMGIEVEKEHTNNKKLAREIAMDHLKEIPDYYTRLAKMEKEAGVEESETSLKGGEAHKGTGGSLGAIGRDGTLEWLQMLKDEEAKGRRLKLQRTELDAV